MPTDYGALLGPGTYRPDDEENNPLGRRFDTAPAPMASAAPMQQMTGGDVDDSGRFVNFERFFNANAGKQAQAANREMEDVSKKGEQLSQDVGKAQQDFRDAYAQNRATSYNNETILPNQGPQAGSSRQGVSQQALTGTPQRSGGGGQYNAPPGAITQAEAQARAGQTYGGPSGLGGYDALLQRSQDLDKQAAALGTQEGLQGALGTRYGAGATSRAAALDAATARAAGGAALKGTADRYSHNEEGLNAKQKEASGMAQDEATLTSAYGQQWKDALDKFESDQRSAKDKAAASAAKTKKAKSYSDYLNGPQDAAYYIKQAGTGVSPLDSIWHAVSGGADSPIDKLTDSYESQYGHPFGNSRSAVDAFRRAGPAGEAVYNSMTPAELEQMSKLSQAEQMQWIANRQSMLSQGWTP